MIWVKTVSFKLNNAYTENFCCDLKPAWFEMDMIEINDINAVCFNDVHILLDYDEVIRSIEYSKLWNWILKW